MSNLCSYSMKVVGASDKLKEFYKIISYKYKENGPHLYRVFEASEPDEEEYESEAITIVGCCAWSVYSCMMRGPHTYYDDDVLKNPETNGTYLEELSERLGLKIEFYSEEYGCCFEEHYIIDNGKIIINECLDASEYCTEDFNTVEEFNKEHGLSVSQEQFENESFIVIGGFGQEINFTI